MRHLVEGAQGACLVISIEDPVDVGSIDVWELYRFGEEVVVQESLWPPAFVAAVDLGDIHKHVFPYAGETDDGTEISEWRLPLSDFADYLAGSGSSPA